jgi:aryl-alcohol dehydrogenase-like predicted oxidoreductase
LLACSPAIPGTASAAHVEENVAAASLCLDDEEVLAIASAVS